MQHAVIMAGGSGTRLWPLSRKSTPKQFQKLTGDRTLIQQTFDRIVEVIPSERIWVVTGESYKQLVLEQLPEVDASRVITEPVGRNTAPATLLAVKKILSVDPDAVMFGLLPADHYVGKKQVFISATKAALSFIEKNRDRVVTLGLHPTEANTGLGYIKFGSLLEKVNSRQIFSVESFHEKPDQKTAQQFLESGQYLWNGGYYLFSAKEMLSYFEQLAPEINQAVENYITNPTLDNYQLAPAEAIDTAISEKLSTLAVIPVEMDWSDVGNWATLHEILVSQGKNSEAVFGDHVGNGSQNSLILGGSKLIATVGVKDIVVVDTEDVILICDKNSVQDVKQIVEQLQKQGRDNLL